MLPFLHRKDEGGVSSVLTVHRKPDTEQAPDGVEMAAKDLKEAIAIGDIKGIAAALRAAFEILDSEPHVEGEHYSEGE